MDQPTIVQVLPYVQYEAVQVYQLAVLLAGLFSTDLSTLKHSLSGCWEGLGINC